MPQLCQIKDYQHNRTNRGKSQCCDRIQGSKVGLSRETRSFTTSLLLHLTVQILFITRQIPQFGTVRQSVAVEHELADVTAGESRVFGGET